MSPNSLKLNKSMLEIFCKRSPIIFFFLIYFSCILNAQENNTLFFMNSIPQSNLINPAVQIPCKVFVGMPGLSSVYFNYSNTYFSYNDVLTRSPGDTLNINVGHFATKPGTRQVLAVDFQISLLNFGFIYKKYYFNFNVSDKINVGFVYPTNWFQLVLAGNTGFAGKTMDLGNAKITGLYYREWAFGVSKIVDDKLTIGVKAKLLFGKANVYTGNSDLGLNTSLPLNYLTASSNASISGSPFILSLDKNGNISSFDLANKNNPVKLILNNQNKGFATDLGFIYKYDNKITLSGSLLDLGFIRWSYFPVQVSNSTTLTYRGFTHIPSAASFDSLQQLVDSMQSIFKLKTINKPYTTFLSPNLYLGGTYDLTHSINAGLLLHNNLYQGKLTSSVTTSLNAKYKKYFSGSISWSYINNSFSNIGEGLGMRTPNFGIYLVSDNVYGAIKFKSARLLNVRFGMNFLFGCSSCTECEKKIKFKEIGCRVYNDSYDEEQRINNLKAKLKKHKKKHLKDKN